METNMGIDINTKKGYFTLEAAIFLPIFILALLLLGYFIKIVGIHENIAHITLDESNQLASKAYVTTVAPGFKTELEERIRKEIPEITEIDVSHFRYLVRENDTDGIITFKLRVSIKVGIPISFKKEYRHATAYKFRGFIGKHNRGTPVSFDEMEREGNSHIVWVFPMSGKKYHKQSCRYVTAHPVQKVLNHQIKNQYTPCKRCKPEALSYGLLVYCFQNTGKAYHQGSCKTIEKYTVEIEEREALHKGYIPCSVCNGGQNGNTKT